MNKKNKIYFEVETEKEKIDELVKSVEKLNKEIEYLKNIGINRRNLNKLFKELIKIEIK